MDRRRELRASLLGIAALAALQCATPRGPAPSPPAAASPLAGSPAAASSAAPPPSSKAAATPSRFCVDASFRQSRLEAAWPEGDRTFVCVHRDPPESDAGAPDRSCVVIDPSGNYVAAPGAVPVEPHVASASFRRESRDGDLRFELVGGKRTSHGATGILRDARTGRVLKRGPVEYDEYLEFLGWIGKAVVLRTHVDEGPGCVLTWIDPVRTWPPSIASRDDGGAEPLVDCFDGDLVLQPADGA